MDGVKTESRKKAEHSPCPTPERAIYGFVLYFMTYVLFGFYLLWAILPDEWLHNIGLDYLPQRLWIFLGPFLFVFGVFTALSLFLIKNWIETPTLNSLNNLTDQHQRLWDEVTDEQLFSVETLLPLKDVYISDFNKKVYLNDGTFSAFSA